MSLLDDDEYDIPAPRMGAKFWKATKLVEMDDILYFGLRIHSPEGIKQRLEIVAERIFAAGFQFENEYRKWLGNQLRPKKRPDCKLWKADDSSDCDIQ